MNRSSFGSNNLGTSGSECGLYVDLLPLIDTVFLSVDERATVRGHLAGCAACRTRLAAFAPVDAALRRYVDWLEVEATHPSAWLAEEDILHLTDEYTDPAPFPAELSPNPTPSHLPNSSARPTRFHSGLAAIAAVLLIALSATVFVLFGYGRNSPAGRVTQQSTCAPNQISAHLPNNARLTDLAMISPDEGWLVGSTYDPQASGPVITKSLILHYSHCQWTQEPITLLGVALGIISVVSASNVWVEGYKESFQRDSQGEYEVLTTLALHYTGRQWQEMPFPITVSSDQVVADFTMISSTEGWILVEQRNSITWGPPYQLYHGVNGVWSLVSTPGYQNLWLVKPFAPGAAWLIGEDSTTGLPRLLLYHNGMLTPMYTLPPNALLYMNADIQIEMDSPQSAWVSTLMLNAHGQTGWLLLNCSLSSCSQSSLANDPRIQTSDTVEVFSANVGWAFRSKNQQGAPAGSIESVFQLQNGQWQSVPWSFHNIEDVNVIVQTRPDEFWAVANHSSILHFVNGEWWTTSASTPTHSAPTLTSAPTSSLQPTATP